MGEVFAEAPFIVRSKARKASSSSFVSSITPPGIALAIFCGSFLALASPACGGSTVGAASGNDTDAGSGSGDDSGVVLADAGPPVDIGTPSNTYPAPHPAAPEVESYGGSVLTAPHVQPILFPNDALESDIQAFTHALHGSSYWNAATSEYGVGDITASDPIIVPEADTQLTGPTTLTDAQIQTWLQTHLDGAHAGWGTPDPNTIYAVYYPANVTITLDPFGESCQGFGGYHMSTNVNGTVVPYAVLPRCQQLGTLNNEKDVTTGASSHELIEASTDPFGDAPAYASADENHLYYDLVPLSEVGDMCAYESDAFITPPEIGYAVQRTWSNKLAKLGKSPCAPALDSSIYFAAVPVMNDTVDMNFGAQGGSVPVKGVKVPLGQSAVIELDLISGAAMDPFFVKVVDIPSQEGKAAELSFSLDAESGQNGQKLHATVTRIAHATQYGGTEFMVIAYADPTHYHEWMGWAAE